MPRLYGFEDQSRRRLRDDEVGPLREAASRALAGQSNADVAAWLNGEGHKGTLGGDWKDASVGRLFRNPAIAGLREDENGELVDAGHPGAITPEEFMDLRARENKRKTAPADPPHDYLLVGGACTCGKCTKSLQGARTNAGTPGYRCRPKDKNGRGGCGEVRIDADLLETYVGEHVVAELLKPGLRDQILKAHTAVAAQVTVLAEGIADLENRRKEIATLYGSRQISRDALVAAEQEIAANLKEQRSRLRFAEQMAALSLGGAKDLVKWWNGAPLGSKQAITSMLLEKVEVFPASARGVRTIEPGRVVLRWRNLSGLSGDS